ncbi:hypothetical protein NMY22_g11369 [Coprinellus aureogranulatus]|nr:hypothetical protein NMY22_g11369 [Coprinellus aureogranulatus]
MTKYDPPNVVYRGYIVTTDEYLQMMQQIPGYKDSVMDDGGYGYDNHMMCYTHWKKIVLDVRLRSKAPKIKEHRTSGVRWPEPATHMMLLSSFINAEKPNLVKDRDLLLETENDRIILRAMVKFFQKQGITDLKVEDFQYTYSVGVNPTLLTVRAVGLIPCSSSLTTSYRLPLR